MRNRLAAVLELVGAGLFLFGLWMLSAWAVVCVAGVALVGAAVRIEGRP